MEFDKSNQRASMSNRFHNRIYKALIVLIIGVLLLSVFECIELLRSSRYFENKGNYRAVRTDINKDSVAPISNSLTRLNGATSLPAAEILTRTNGEFSSSPTTIIPQTTNSASNMLLTVPDIVKIQTKRQINLRNYCRMENSVRRIKPRRQNVFYSDRQGVIYCSVPKAACTNWKRVLQVFDGNINDPLDITNKQRVHKLKYSYLLRLETKEKEWRKNLYYSFMFVRHPFERLLSAYRNKFRDPYNSLFQRRYGSTILRLHRKNLTSEEYEKGENVTFEEFVNYLIYLYDNNKMEKIDEHWQVMHKLCSPCTMKYNYIGKMETLLLDASEVLKQMGLDKRVKFPANATDKYKEKTKYLMKSHYSKLSTLTIKTLYKIYEDDFLSFGYEIPDYL